MPTNATKFFLSPTDSTDNTDYFFFDSLFDFVKCARQMTQIFFRCAIFFVDILEILGRGATLDCCLAAFVFLTKNIISHGMHGMHRIYRCAMVFRHDDRRTWFLATNYHNFFLSPQIAQITLIIFFRFALWLRQMRSTDNTDFFSLRDSF